MAPLNSSMVAVALPDIMLDFDVGISSAGWLIIAYLIAMASLQPLAGKLGDNFGHRTMVISGLAVFGIVSLGAALAPSLIVLMVFRVLQAVSAALIVPNAAAILREILPVDRRGAGFGLMGASIGVAAALGPPVGGVLVEVAGWRAIFYVNLLFVIPPLIIGVKHLARAMNSATKREFDIYGAVALPAILVAAAWILISFSKGSNPWVVGFGVPLVVIGAVLLGWFEKRHPDPIVQLNFFVQKAFSSAALASHLPTWPCTRCWCPYRCCCPAWMIRPCESG